ncbi:hypothetical protein ACFL35_20250, partial [Candidatus Riflebacteria bacterium]
MLPARKCPSAKSFSASLTVIFPTDFYEIGKEKEIERASQMTSWICNQERMDRTNDARFVHPMPVDRGKEVTDE